MNFSDIYYLLSDYSVDKILLAGASLGITLLLKKTLLRKKLHRLLSIMPFIAGITLNLTCAMLMGSGDSFGMIIKSGLSTGSAATVLYAGICGLTEERGSYEVLPFDSLVIEGLLAGYVDDGMLSSVASECADVLRLSLSAEKEHEELKKLLTEKTAASDAEAEMLAKIIRNTLAATEN